MMHGGGLIIRLRRSKMKICIIAGVMIFGWLLPEVAKVMSPHKVEVPILVSILTFLGSGLIATGILYS